MEVPPSSDASSKFGQLAPPPNGVPAREPQLLASESRAVVDFRYRHCACGCGAPAIGRNFVPGHNQRLRGDLARAHQRGQRVLVRQTVGRDHLLAPADVAEMLGEGWLAWVAPDVRVQSDSERAAKAALAVAADVFEAEWGDL